MPANPPSAPRDTPESDAAEYEPVTMRYTNWRGETAMRKVVPISLSFGSNEWHPEPQHLLNALDVDKGEMRAFALKDCDFTSLLARPAGEGWRPIEAAPKDGTPVLICDERTASMRWAVWSEGAWRDGRLEAGGVTVGLPSPTHWRPLPAPPGACLEPAHGEAREAARVLLAVFPDNPKCGQDGQDWAMAYASLAGFADDPEGLTQLGRARWRLRQALRALAGLERDDAMNDALADAAPEGGRAS